MLKHIFSMLVSHSHHLHPHLYQCTCTVFASTLLPLLHIILPSLSLRVLCTHAPFLSPIQTLMLFFNSSPPCLLQATSVLFSLWNTAINFYCAVYPRMVVVVVVLIHGQAVFSICKVCTCCKRHATQDSILHFGLTFWPHLIEQPTSCLAFSLSAGSTMEQEA